MEDMLIARIKTYMQVRYTKGRQLCYQDHIINFPQDITEIAAKLPRLPEDTDLVIIRRDDVDMSRHIDFTVRRQKVLDALEYKIAHDPAYADLEIDQDALMSLPENGSVVHCITTCREGRQDPDSAVRVGPDAAANVGSGEEGNFQEEIVGVGGVVNLGNTLEIEVDAVRNAASAIIQDHAGAPYSQNIVSCNLLTTSFGFYSPSSRLTLLRQIRFLSTKRQQVISLSLSLPCFPTAKVTSMNRAFKKLIWVNTLVTCFASEEDVSPAIVAFLGSHSIHCSVNELEVKRRSS